MKKTKRGFQKLKEKHPNLYLLIAGIGFVMFWKGAYTIIGLYFPENLESGVFLTLAGLTIIYLNDFKLTEFQS